MCRHTVRTNVFPVDMSVIGFDFGTDACIISVCKRGSKGGPDVLQVCGLLCVCVCVGFLVVACVLRTPQFARHRPLTLR